MLRRRILFSLWLLAATTAINAKVFVVAGNYQVYMPPFYWLDHCTQQRQGFGWELQRHLWKDLGVDFVPLHLNLVNNNDHQLLYARIQRGEIDVFQSIAQTDNEFIRTTKVPFFNPDTAIFYHQKSRWQYQNWDSLKHKKGGWVSPNGLDIRSTEFQHYASQHLSMAAYPSYSSGFEALHRGEVDYIITFKAVGAAVIKHYDYDGIKSVASKGIARPSYLAIAKNSPLAARSDDIDQLLRRYQETGILQVLLQSNMAYWLTARNTSCTTPMQ